MGVLVPVHYRNLITRDVLDEEVLTLSDEHRAPDCESGCLSPEGGAKKCDLPRPDAGYTLPR